MKAKTRKTICLALVGLSILSARPTFAVTEVGTKENENTYQRTVKLTKDEEEDFLNKLNSKITINGEEYQLEGKNKITEDSEKTKEVTKNIQIQTLYDTNNKNSIMNRLGQSIEYNECGFKGNISLNNILIETVPQGSYEQLEYLDIDFMGYTQNELANVEKEITRNGYNWNLINVDWNVETTTEIDNTNVPKTYSGVKHYQRVGTYQYPNKYRVTAVYSGIVEKQNPESIYQITYNKVIKEEPKVEEKEEPKQEKMNENEAILFVGTIGFTFVLGIFLFKNRKKINEFKIKK